MRNSQDATTKAAPEGDLTPARPAAGTPQPLDVEALHCLGDYILLGQIATGGMGVVYRARQISLNRKVALKVLRSGRLASAVELDRFRTEAEAAANLGHPSIVEIFEVGQLEGHPYLSMRLIEGGSLAEAIQDGNWRMTERNKNELQPRIARLVSKVARIVHYAHQHGVLHRDLKPGNILMDEQGEPHLTDFGLAKLVQRDLGQTQTQAVMGTPAYMSPEQATSSKRVTTASDTYSLGAILYELLTGQPPFVGESAGEILLRLQTRDPPAPRTLNRLIHRDLETICLKCLEKEPARRYVSAASLADDLERWGKGEPITARPVSLVERGWKWVQRNRKLAGLSFALAVAVALGLAGFNWQARRTQQERQRTTQTELHAELAKAETEFGPGGEAQDALARLAWLLRNHPTNRVVTERLLNAMEHRRFLVAAGLPLPGGIECCGASATGETLALAGTDAQGGVVYACDRGGGRLAEFAAGDEAPFAVAASHDGALVAAGYPDHVRAWSVAQRRLLFESAYTDTDVHREGIRFLGGERLLVTAGRRVELRSTSDGRLVRAFIAPDADISQARATSDVRLVAAATERGSLHVWEAESGVLLRSVPQAHTNIIRDLDFTPDGSRLASAGEDRRACVWDTVTGKNLKQFHHAGPVYSAVFSPDATRLLTASQDGTARLWTLDESGTGTPLIMGHRGEVNRACFSPNGRWIATAGSYQDGTARVWDAREATETARFSFGPAEAVRSIEFCQSDGSRLLAVAGATAVALALTPGERSASVAMDPPAPASEPMSASLLRSFEDASGVRLSCGRRSPDGLRVVISTNDRRVRVLDAQTRQPLTGWLQSERAVAEVWFSPDGSLVISDQGQCWKVRKAESEAPRWLADLAEAVAGERLTDSGDLVPTPLGAFRKITLWLQSENPPGPFTDWARKYVTGLLEALRPIPAPGR